MAAEPQVDSEPLGTLTVTEPQGRQGLSRSALVVAGSAAAGGLGAAIVVPSVAASAGLR